MARLELDQPTAFIFATEDDSDALLLGFKGGVTVLADGGRECLPFMKALRAPISAVVSSASLQSLPNAVALNEDEYVPVLGALPSSAPPPSASSDTAALLRNLHSALGDYKLTAATVAPKLEPITLYKNIAVGTLSLYVLAGDAKEVTQLQKVISSGADQAAVERAAAAASLVSLFVWEPASSSEPIKRVLHAGSSSLARVQQALERARALPFMHAAHVTAASLEQQKGAGKPVGGGGPGQLAARTNGTGRPTAATSDARQSAAPTTRPAPGAAPSARAPRQPSATAPPPARSGGATAAAAPKPPPATRPPRQALGSNSSGRGAGATAGPPRSPGGARLGAMASAAGAAPSARSAPSSANRAFAAPSSRVAANGGGGGAAEPAARRQTVGRQMGSAPSKAAAGGAKKPTEPAARPPGQGTSRQQPVAVAPAAPTTPIAPVNISPVSPLAPALAAPGDVVRHVDENEPVEEALLVSAAAAQSPSTPEHQEEDEGEEERHEDSRELLVEMTAMEYPESPQMSPTAAAMVLDVTQEESPQSDRQEPELAETTAIECVQSPQMSPEGPQMTTDDEGANAIPQATLVVDEQPLADPQQQQTPANYSSTPFRAFRQSQDCPETPDISKKGPQSVTTDESPQSDDLHSNLEDVEEPEMHEEDTTQESSITEPSPQSEEKKEGGEGKKEAEEEKPAVGSGGEGDLIGDPEETPAAAPQDPAEPTPAPAEEFKTPLVPQLPGHDGLLDGMEEPIRLKKISMDTDQLTAAIAGIDLNETLTTVDELENQQPPARDELVDMDETLISTAEDHQEPDVAASGDATQAEDSARKLSIQAEDNLLASVAAPFTAGLASTIVEAATIDGAKATSLDSMMQPAGNAEASSPTGEKLMSYRSTGLENADEPREVDYEKSDPALDSVLSHLAEESEKVNGHHQATEETNGPAALCMQTEAGPTEVRMGLPPSKAAATRNGGSAPKEVKFKLGSPLYVDLTTVPHAGGSVHLPDLATARDYFYFVRSSHYVVPTSEGLGTHVLEGWLSAKQQWVQDAHPSRLVLTRSAPPAAHAWAAEYREELSAAGAIFEGPPVDHSTLTLNDTTAKAMQIKL